MLLSSPGPRHRPLCWRVLMAILFFLVGRHGHRQVMPAARAPFRGQFVCGKTMSCCNRLGLGREQRACQRRLSRPTQAVVACQSAEMIEMDVRAREVVSCVPARRLQLSAGQPRAGGRARSLPTTSQLVKLQKLTNSTTAKTTTKSHELDMLMSFGEWRARGGRGLAQIRLACSRVVARAAARAGCGSSSVAWLCCV